MSLPPSPAHAARGRVLLVAPQPFFRVTGTPINILMMCRALTEAGFEVHLATLPHGEEVALDGLVVHRVRRLPRVDSVPVGFSAAKTLYNFLLIARLCGLLLRGRFVAVHAMEEAAFYAVPLARLCGVPAIVDLDSDLAQQLGDHPSALVRCLARPARVLRRHALRRAACAISVARHMSDLARAESPGTPLFEIKDIPLDSATRTPDLARMQACRAQLGLRAARLIVYTGNYDRRQGLEDLVDGMPRVLGAHPDAVLVVVGGEADDIRRLQQRVDAAGLAGSIRLIGPRPPETMAEYMGMAEVLVSPRLEPLATPLKIFSYMASGRPIVATDLPTHTQILDSEAAILVPPTAEGLACGIVRALDDPKAAARLGRRAQALVRERHTYQEFKRRLVEAYDRALCRPRAGSLELSGWRAAP